jgi:hypothetical protein
VHDKGVVARREAGSAAAGRHRIGSEPIERSTPR